MAISEDTAALVAAQLTVAWAARMGIGKPNPSNPADTEILTRYKKYRALVAETVAPPDMHNMRKLLE